MKYYGTTQNNKDLTTKEYVDGQGGGGGGGLPPITSEDEGAFLRAIDGVAVWSIVPRAEDNTF